MHVVITGGSGLIGRALAADLVGGGHQATILSRRTGAALPGLPAGVTAVRWDGRSAAGWAELADGADAIVNLAGASIGAGRWTPARKQVIRHSRLEAGRAVTEVVRRAANRPRVVVQASGIGYYGPRGDEEVTETAAPGNDFLARVAVEWEQSTAGVAELGVRHVVVRSGLVLSTQGGSFPRLLLPFRLFAGGPLGSGRQWYSWVHLADEVAAMRFLIEHPAAQGAFNLTAPQPVTNRAFAAALGRVLQRPGFVLAPAFALKLLLGEMATLVLTGQRVVPERLLALGFTFRFPALEAALRDLLRFGTPDR
jgi:uncharacterized protein (TIGR01777 family)